MTVRETVDARKEKYGPDDLEELFAGAKEVIVARGKRFERFDPADARLRRPAGSGGLIVGLARHRHEQGGHGEGDELVEGVVPGGSDREVEGP